MLANTFPSLKNQSETENESRATRSSVRRPSGRRQSTSPRRKTAQSKSQTSSRLIDFPPKAPS
jgi:hypothetical protein